MTTQVFTLAEVLQILKNMGHDVECGACMAIAFTNVGLPHDEHTCEELKPKEKSILEQARDAWEDGQ